MKAVGGGRGCGETCFFVAVRVGECDVAPGVDGGLEGRIAVSLFVCSSNNGRQQQQAGRQAGRVELVSRRRVTLAGPPPGLGCKRGGRGEDEC